MGAPGAASRTIARSDGTSLRGSDPVRTIRFNLEASTGNCVMGR